MKILLIGPYKPLQQQSMLRLAELLRETQSKQGHEVRLLHPRPVFGRLRPAQTGLGKWLGYLDRLVLFRAKLQTEIPWADVVHICDHADAIYVPWLGGKPHVVTCNDMLAIRSARGEIPQNPTRFTGRLYQRWILSGLRQAERIVCISEETRNDVLRITGLSSDRVTVVLLSLNYPYQPMVHGDAVTKIKCLGIQEGQSFFLHVGGNPWYKNRPGVIRIFQALTGLEGFAHHDLVMAGQPFTTEMRNMLQELGLASRVHELIDVSNSDLQALYSVAESLIYPSLHEGFGWPVIEAQACGCPVFTSNRPPMTEVGGEAAVYFDLTDPPAAASVIANGLRRREAMKQAGFVNLARFASAEMTKGYLRAYEAVTCYSGFERS